MTMTLRRNRLAEAFASGKPTLGTHIFLPEPAVVETIGHTGVYDYVEFLAEYNAFTLHDLDALARTCELADMGSLIKVDWESNRYIAQRAVGSGFDGVLFTDPRSEEDVDYVIASVRPDHPDHRGSYGASSRRNVRPDYGGSAVYRATIAETVVGVMVETPQIFDHLQAVLTRGEIGFIQWGPADFAMRSGLRDDEKPHVIAERERELIRLCDEHRVPYRIEIHRPEDMQAYADQGARHFSIGYDLWILHDNWRRLGDAVRTKLEDYS